MKKQKILSLRRKRRVLRVRNKHASRGYKSRISVFRSAKHIYAQMIDDFNHRTVASFSSSQLSEKVGDKKAVAKLVGLELGKIFQEKSNQDVFFDRGLYRYHGRVKALADGLRESGLQF